MKVKAEIGCRRAPRDIESPGRFDPNAPQRLYRVRGVPVSLGIDARIWLGQ